MKIVKIELLSHFPQYKKKLKQNRVKRAPRKLRDRRTNNAIKLLQKTSHTPNDFLFKPSNHRRWLKLEQSDYENRSIIADSNNHFHPQHSIIVRLCIFFDPTVQLSISPLTSRIRRFAGGRRPVKSRKRSDTSDCIIMYVFIVMVRHGVCRLVGSRRARSSFRNSRFWRN